MWKNRLWRRREVSLAPSVTRTPAVPSVAVRRTRETRLKLFAIREITHRGISSETVPRVWLLTSTIKHSQPRPNKVLRGGQLRLKDLSVEHTVEYPPNSEPASGRLCLPSTTSSSLLSSVTPVTGRRSRTRNKPL